MSDDPLLSSVQAPRSGPAEEAWHEIEDLVHEIARLSKSESSRRAFYSRLLGGAVPALAAVAGAVWLRRPEGLLGLECQVNLSQLEIEQHSAIERAHSKLLDLVLRSGRPKIVAPRTGVADDEQAFNSTPCLALMCPVVLEQEPMGVIEIFQRPGTSPAAQRGYLQFLEALSELAVDFHRNHALRELRERAGQWTQFEEFTEEVHGSLDLRATCFTIANSGCRFIACDRVSALVFSSGKCRTIAVSGMDTFDRRSNLIRRMEALSALISQTDRPLWHPGLAPDFPPEIELALHAYLDESHARMLAVVPLRSAAEPLPGSPQSPVGALVVERFSGGSAEAELEYRVASIRPQCELALRNALAFESLPLHSISLALQRVGWLTRARALPKVALVAIGGVAIILGLILVPAEFEIAGRGALQPQIRRDVFAGADGVVQEVLAEHDKKVAAGDVVVLLQKSQLDFEFSRVLGEIKTTQRKLASVHASRLGTSPTSAEDRDQYNKLTAEEEELRELLKSLQEQHRILLIQQQELKARSPISGQVLTWDLKQLLQARPVHRGQTLLTVADLNGPWILEIQLPDNRVGHVLAAQRELGEKLAVSFILVTDPEVTFSGDIEKVALATDLDENQQPSVLVTVHIERDEIPHRRPGATVISKIHCGRKPLGYVWFHDLWDAIRTRLLF